jgi:hypothetical protein
MPVSRVALYALSLLSLVLAVRGTLGKPLSYSTVLALAGLYGSLLALGASRPRLQLFADVCDSVAADQCAIVVRCANSEVGAWLRALEPSGLAVTFSLIDASDEAVALVEGSPHAIVARILRLAIHTASPRTTTVKLIDAIGTWHTPWFGRALRRANLLWLVPRRVVAATQSRLGVAPGDVVAVMGAPDEKAIAHWRTEVAESRVTAVAFR